MVITWVPYFEKLFHKDNYSVCWAHLGPLLLFVLALNTKYQLRPFWEELKFYTKKFHNTKDTFRRNFKILFSWEQISKLTRERSLVPEQGSHEKLFSEKCFSFCEISRKRKTAKTKNFGFWKIEKLRKPKIKRNGKTKNCEKQSHKQRKTFFSETEKMFFAKKHFYFAVFSRR